MYGPPAFTGHPVAVKHPGDQPSLFEPIGRLRRELILLANDIHGVISSISR